MIINKFHSFLAIGVLFFSINACSPITKVYSEEEPGTNLYKYHTYNWLDDSETHEGNKGPEWLTNSTQNQIRNSVENRMVTYGFKICTEKPDLMLHYHVVIDNKVFYVRDRYCEMQGQTPYGRCNRLRAVQYQEGTLIVDFIDTKTSNQVWRGVAIGVLDDINPKEVNGHIEKAVEAIFKKFPEQKIPVAAL